MKTKTSIPMNLVAADVSPLQLAAEEVRADSRPLLRFKRSTREYFRGVLTLASLLALFGGNLVAAPMNTAFSYQGRLNAAGSPANGLYDLTFTLFADITNTPSIAGPITNAAVTVSNGLFSVLLDFGAGAFNGEARWLEIGVRTNGATSFTTLDPRQAITALPYALYAMTPLLTPTNGIVNANSMTLAGVGGSWNISADADGLNFAHDSPGPQKAVIGELFLAFKVLSGLYSMIVDADIVSSRKVSVDGDITTKANLNVAQDITLGGVPWKINVGDFNYSGQIQASSLQFSTGSIAPMAFTAQGDFLTLGKISAGGNITAEGVFTGNGSGLTNLPSASAIPHMLVFTNSGTFTIPAGVTRVMVEVWGGGGGGGSAIDSYNNGHGGGGGGYGRQVCDVTPGTDYPVTVGPGGGSNADGGTSSFGSLIQATGGGAGASRDFPSHLEVGGTSTANVSRDGELYAPNGDYTGGGASGFGGRGGHYVWVGETLVYVPSKAPGGGGGGGIFSVLGSGGTGARGQVIVYY